VAARAQVGWFARFRGARWKVRDLVQLDPLAIGRHQCHALAVDLDRALADGQRDRIGPGNLDHLGVELVNLPGAHLPVGGDAQLVVAAIFRRIDRLRGPPVAVA
jgi:hypothetical protein